MRHHNTLMHDILKPMPWGAFNRLVEKHKADKHVRKLSTKNQLIALVHAQLSGATSLREIETTMSSHHARLYHLGLAAPKRSTLASALPAGAGGVALDFFAFFDFALEG